MSPAEAVSSISEANMGGFNRQSESDSVLTRVLTRLPSKAAALH